MKTIKTLYWLAASLLMLAFVSPAISRLFYKNSEVNTEILVAFCGASFLFSVLANLYLVKIGKKKVSNLFVWIFGSLFLFPPIGYIGMLILFNGDIKEMDSKT